MDESTDATQRRRRDAKPDDGTDPEGVALLMTAWHAAPPEDGDAARPVDAAGSTYSTSTYPAYSDEGPGGLDSPDDVDADLLPAATRAPMGKLTATLLVGLVAAGSFAGGVVMQKNHDSVLVSGSSASAAGRVRSFGGGFGPGGFGAGGQGGGQGTGTTGSAPNGAATGAPSDVPVVVGEVVSVKGSTLTVRNLGGKTVTVQIPEGLTVSTVSIAQLSSLKVGTLVSIAGQVAGNGSVTASSITVRVAQ